MKKVHVATSREVGARCATWATQNTPRGYKIVDSMEDCDIFISVLYEKLISKEYIENRKCYNFHPGILPEYRGSGAYSWTIINQDKKCGISLHEIDAGIDTGNVIEIREFLVSKGDTAYSLHERGTEIIFKMFKDWFLDLLTGNYIAVKQDAENAKTYYRKDLNSVKDITKYVKAFHFPSKEPAYYINSKGVKVYINFEGKNK